MVPYSIDFYRSLPFFATEMGANIAPMSTVYRVSGITNGIAIDGVRVGYPFNRGLHCATITFEHFGEMYETAAVFLIDQFDEISFNFDAWNPVQLRLCLDLATQRFADKVYAIVVHMNGRLVYFHSNVHHFDIAAVYPMTYLQTLVRSSSIKNNNNSIKLLTVKRKLSRSCKHQQSDEKC